MADTVPDVILVHQGVDPNYLQTILTKDITVLEALFDLVDNSIDAARDKILVSPHQTDKYGLPNNYSGYRIALRVSADQVAIADNCAGIEESELRDRIFVTGAASEHDYGIGRFGIGLKRALFRLGSTYALSTDTGTFAARMRFSQSDLGNLQDSSMTAQRRDSRTLARTLIAISGLPDSVAHEVGPESFRRALVIELSRRYGRFVRKGLKISVNGSRVPVFGPWVRDKGPSPHKTAFHSTEGVDVFIDSGMHEDYRLTIESGYDTQKTNALTDQYGWYFVCNDRIIRTATHETALGWSAHWHQEYYGFVGWTHFVSREVERLPWDTKKTTIDPNSSVFRDVSPKLQAFAEEYKSETRAFRKTGTSGGGSGGKGGSKGGKGSGGGGKTGGTGTGTGTGKKAKSNESWGTLLPEMTVLVNSRKVEALVAEATELPLEECYAGSMLLRAIMEQCLLAHLRANGGYGEIQQTWFDARIAEGKATTTTQKRNYKPGFAEMLKWFDENEEYYPAEKHRECKNARAKFAKHLGELNGVMHENDLTSSAKLRIVRDDSYPLLEFLIGTAPYKMP